MAWLMAHLNEILVFALALSESLALIPFIKANSIFQLIYGFLIKNAPKKDA